MKDNKEKSINESNTNPNIGYQMYKDSKKEDTPTDIYYKTKKKIPESKVSIPTLDAVMEAKEWVDNVNRK